MKMQIISLTLFILMGSLTQAKTFRNAYISFEMPDTWKCNLEQTEWVCRSDQAQTSKEAIIILTAKETGPTDSFGLYESHLNNPITSPTKGGGSTTSKVIYKVKNVKINEQPWLDSLHLGSEIPMYYTRYLATVKDKIAVLITFSAHKSFYQKYSTDFFNSVKSLQIVAGGNISQQPIVRGGGGTIGQPMVAPLNGPAFTLPDESNFNQKPTSKKSLFGGIAFILAAVGIYIYLKSKKKI